MVMQRKPIWVTSTFVLNLLLALDVPEPSLKCLHLSDVAMLINRLRLDAGFLKRVMLRDATDTSNLFCCILSVRRRFSLSAFKVVSREVDQKRGS